MTSKNLLVELFVEELPPKALKKLGEAFAQTLRQSLASRSLAEADSVVTAYASPRRLAAHITCVAATAPDKEITEKLMPVSIAIGSDGKPTDALRKRLAKVGQEALADLWPNAEDGPDQLLKKSDGKADAVFLRTMAKGASLQVGLEFAIQETLAALPIPKVMSYQLESGCELPGWTSVSFVRPAHGLLALHGADVVPVKVLGLQSGNTTQGHRFEASVSPVVIKDADSYAATLAKDGAVIASFAERRAEIVRQLAAAAAKIGGDVKAIEDEALLDEVTALVERPNVLVCEFEKEFLEVPQECLILTMKANQKYFPLLDAAGKLTNKFLVVSNISPNDASAVIGGNERVVRPRLADAKFFFDQDRKKTLTDRLDGLKKVVYLNRLGDAGDMYSRMERVRSIARAIGQELGGPSLAENAYGAATLAKVDLLTDMVGEFPELQGIMGGYYALHDGQMEAIALAIEDHYKPRFSGDTLPRNQEGVIVAVADKLETLFGLFSVGEVPSGDKDPFALRRQAIGLSRLAIESKLPIGLSKLLEFSTMAFQQSYMRQTQVNRSVDADSAVSSGAHAVVATLASRPGLAAVGLPTLDGVRLQTTNFVYDRLAGMLKEQGYDAKDVEAVLLLRPDQLAEIPRRLEAVRSFRRLDESVALAAANKRISNILKKTDAVDAHFSEELRSEPAEIALFAAMKAITPKANTQFESGDYSASLQTLAALRTPVDAFFENVMVNAEDIEVRLNRLGLLTALHQAMNRVADLSKLAA